MGERAVGYALVKATAGAVTLPPAAHAAPIIKSAVSGSAQSQIDWSRLVKVGERPDPTVPSSRTTALTGFLVDPDAEPDGTTVPIYAMLGGSFYNGSAVGGLRADTGLRWSPPIDGIEATSIVSVELSGGTDFTRPGALKRIVLFDRLGLGNLQLKGGPMLPAETWRAKIGDFPAGVLILMGTRRREDGGRGRPIHELRWRLLVLTSAVGPTEERAQDGDATLDWASGLLQASGEVDGQSFSIPRIEIGDSNLLVADDAMSVHHLDFTTTATIDKIDPRLFKEWTSSDYQLLTTPSAEYPDPEDAIVTVDAEANQ